MKKKWQADMLISEAQVRKCLQEQFPALLLREINCIGEGWDNRVFLVNRSFIFRFPRRQIAIELIERENRVLKHLAFYFSLQIPNPLFEGVPSEGYPYPFQGYRCIKGASVGEISLTPQQRLGSLKPLALFLKQLHSVNEKQALAMGAKPQLFDKTEVGKTIVTFQDRVEQLISLGYQIN
jgi:aminoglycoside phosphotransferase (APT) family kinase protein